MASGNHVFLLAVALSCLPHLAVANSRRGSTATGDYAWDVSAGSNRAGNDEALLGMSRPRTVMTEAELVTAIRGLLSKFPADRHRQIMEKAIEAAVETTRPTGGGSDNVAKEASPSQLDDNSLLLTNLGSEDLETPSPEPVTSTGPPPASASIAAAPTLGGAVGNASASTAVAAKGGETASCQDTKPGGVEGCKRAVELCKTDKQIQEGCRKTCGLCDQSVPPVPPKMAANSATSKAINQTVSEEKAKRNRLANSLNDKWATAEGELDCKKKLKEAAIYHQCDSRTLATCKVRDPYNDNSTKMGFAMSWVSRKSANRIYPKVVQNWYGGSDWLSRADWSRYHALTHRAGLVVVEETENVKKFEGGEKVEAKVSFWGYLCASWTAVCTKTQPQTCTSARLILGGVHARNHTGSTYDQANATFGLTWHNATELETGMEFMKYVMKQFA